MLLLEYRPLENFSVGNDFPNNLPWFLSHPLLICCLIPIPYTVIGVNELI